MSDETKHGPEPWSVTRRRDGIAIRDAGTFLPFDCKETARRIVACVNACAGIPTAALEAGQLGRAMDAAGALVAAHNSDIRGDEWTDRYNAALEALERALFAIEERQP